MKAPQELPFLPSTGGTLTGPLTINTTSTALTLRDGAGLGTIDVTAASLMNIAASGGINSNNAHQMSSSIGVSGTSTLTGVATLQADPVIQGTDADRGGATLTTKLNAMSATLDAAGTHTFSGAIPAGATVVGVTTRVTTTITGCTSIQIGDGTDADRFGNAIALTSGTTTTNADWTITSAPVYAAATNIEITAVGGGASFTAGAMRVCVYYLAPTAPTS